MKGNVVALILISLGAIGIVLGIAAMKQEKENKEASAEEISNLRSENRFLTKSVKDAQGRLDTEIASRDKDFLAVDDRLAKQEEEISALQKNSVENAKAHVEFVKLKKDFEIAQVRIQTLERKIAGLTRNVNVNFTNPIVVDSLKKGRGQEALLERSGVTPPRGGTARPAAK